MPRPKLEDVMVASDSDDYLGFCIHCGSLAEGVEPDAVKYECEVCGEHQVYGADEILIQQLYS